MTIDPSEMDRGAKTPAEHKTRAEWLLKRSSEHLSEAMNPDTGSVKRPLSLAMAAALDQHALVHATLALYKQESNVRSV